MALSPEPQNPIIVNRLLKLLREQYLPYVKDAILWLEVHTGEKLLKIKQSGFWWWKFFLLKPPDSKEFNDKIHKGQELIAQGRHFKGISLAESYKNFKEAYIVPRKSATLS